MIRKFIFSFTLLMVSSYALIAQYQIDLIPRVSPDKAIYAKVGYTNILIEYGSPSAEDRVLWGALVPYDKVWRAGANNATTIEFIEDVVVDGQSLSAGIYALFMIPRQHSAWTVILNKKKDQWGAFSYDASDDVLRMDVMPTRISYVEKLEYRVDVEGFNNAEVAMEWENVRIAFNVQTEYLKDLKSEVKRKVTEADDAIKWVVYLQGAEYLMQENIEKELAMEWINKSEQLSKIEGAWDEQFYPKNYVIGNMYWVKAQVSAAMENYTEAIDYVERLMRLESDYSYYREEKSFEQIDEALKHWKEQ